MARIADPNIKAVYLTGHSIVYGKTEIQKVQFIIKQNKYTH